MNMKTCFLLILSLLVGSFNTATAHQDKIIEIKDGKLIGLPDQYNPANINLEELSLQIGNNKLIFPTCLSKYFTENEQYSLNSSSSWYHDLSRFPPYILLTVEPKNKIYSYQLLFNLDTLNPIQVEKRIRESERITTSEKLEISKECLETIERSKHAI